MDGFTFSLSDPNDAESGFIDLPIMGKTGLEEEGRCISTDINGSIRTIYAHTSRGFVEKIVLSDNDPNDPNSYANTENPDYQWDFAENEEVIAMFGKTNKESKGSRVRQLGWVVLDTECQANKEAEADE